MTMEQTNKYLFITLGLLLFFSCKKECSIQQEQETQSYCETTDLGIDEMSRFSSIGQYPDGSYNFENAIRWRWAEINDTIIIDGSIDPTGEFTDQFFFKKNDQGCIDYLFARSIWYNDYVPNGQNPYVVDESHDFNFILQEYNEGDKVVGRVVIRTYIDIDIDLWVDFDLNNRFYNPYYYNDTN